MHASEIARTTITGQGECSAAVKSKSRNSLRFTGQKKSFACWPSRAAAAHTAGDFSFGTRAFCAKCPKAATRIPAQTMSAARYGVQLRKRRIQDSPAGKQNQHANKRSGKLNAISLKKSAGK